MNYQDKPFFLLIFPALRSRTLAIYRLLARISPGSGYTVYTIECFVLLFTHKYALCSFLHDTLFCMRILFYFFVYQNDKNKENRLDIFIFPSRQLHQEQRGFYDKRFGLFVRRQRQVYRIKKTNLLIVLEIFFSLRLIHCHNNNNFH